MLEIDTQVYGNVIPDQMKEKFYNYYNKITMCREDYKRGKKDTFCVQDCRGRCVPTYLNKEINKAKNRSNSNVCLCS